MAAVIAFKAEAPRVSKHSRRPLRILLSAYACEPDRGSEPGIGWQWATRLAQCGHEIYVLTRSNNAAAIKHALSEHPIPTLHFAYFDLPKWARFWKRGGHGVQLYYFLWQWLSFMTAYRLHREHRFDITHHLTFGVFRQPSGLAFLDAPCIFGPVGGGEQAPRSLRRGLPFAAQAREFARDLANAYAKFDPLLRAALKRTTKILCKTEETRNCVPRAYRDHCELFLEIGTDAKRVTSAVVASLPHSSAQRLQQPAMLRVLYVGRLVYLKGLHLALPAFAQHLQEFPESRFTLVGSGPQESALRLQAIELKIDHRVEWVSWLPRESVLTTYPQHDVFLFPSLHDSSGNALLEAMTRGLPVVCLKLGGPAAIVDAFSGISIDATQPALAIEQMGNALSLLASNPALRNYLAEGAEARATNYFSWTNQVERMNSLYYELQSEVHSDVEAVR